MVLTTPTKIKRVNSVINVLRLIVFIHVADVYKKMRTLFGFIIDASDVFADDSETDRLDASEQKNGCNCCKVTERSDAFTTNAVQREEHVDEGQETND